MRDGFGGAKRGMARSVGLAAVLVMVFSTAAYAAAPGDLDKSFGGGDGKITTERKGYNRALAVQPDNKFLVAGYNKLYNGDFAVARRAADGSADRTFSGDGRLTTSFGGVEEGVEALAVQPDGKTVAVGYSFNNATDYDFALARYNPDGSLDDTFSGDGKLTTDFNGDSDQANAVVLQEDGKILAAGSEHVVGSGRSHEFFALARYNPDGSPDTTFDEDGKLTTRFGGKDVVADDLAVQPDGKIIALGYTSRYFDDGFGNITHYTDFALARYNPDGSLDTTFSRDGMIVTDFNSDFNVPNDLALQEDGKIIVVGSSDRDYESTEFVLVRYKANGALDQTFDGNGYTFTRFPGNSYTTAETLDIRRKDGKIVVAGYSGGDFAIARYAPNGRLDPTFSGDGRDTTGMFDEPFTSIVRDFVFQEDGKKVVVSGGVYRGSNPLADPYPAFARYLAQ